MDGVHGFLVGLGGQALLELVQQVGVVAGGLRAAGGGDLAPEVAPRKAR